MNAFLIPALVLGFNGNAAAPQRAPADGTDPAAIEKVVRDNIGWALTTDRPLLERTMAQDERLFIFNPTADTTVGWQQFVKKFDLWMDRCFMATSTQARTAVLVVAALCGAGRGLAGPANPPARSSATEPRSATLPFVMDHDRMIVELELSSADGTARKVRAWVDTGQVGLGLTEAVAKDLALAPGAAAPRLRLGGITLDTEGIEVRVGEGARVNPGVPAEVHLPAAALRHHHVVFDYPARRLTIARPGVLTPRGAAVPCRVHPVTGLFQVDATADGETLPLAVDNGSSSTWVSVALVERWKARHPDWPSATGAVGTTNFFGFGFEAQGVLMRLPELGIGGHRSRGVALLGLNQDLFGWYSRKTEAAVVGFIGGNVLKGYRLEVDFPGRTTYWEAGGALGTADLDTVGLTLRPNTDGSFTVAGVATKDGRPTVEGVQAGDTLLRVENLDATNASMGAVADALRGEPGALRSLLVERNGAPIRVKAVVRRFP